MTNKLKVMMNKMLNLSKKLKAVQSLKNLNVNSNEYWTTLRKRKMIEMR